MLTAMKKTFLLLLCFPVLIICAQEKLPHRYEAKLSAGRVLFGTGDIPGYGINIEGARSLSRQPEDAPNRLLVGVELSFENGAKRPVVENPTTEQYLAKSFAQVSNSVITGKITWYPFRSVLSGFNIAAGPSVGYMHYVRDASYHRREIYPGYVRREAILTYSDAVLFGYRISAGYELRVSKKVLLGIRADFANYDNGDINTLAAGKFGFRF
jgi:hypothetical protein